MRNLHLLTQTFSQARHASGTGQINGLESPLTETKFGARLHDIRHKFAIERLKEGWSVYRVQRYLGHNSVTTTEEYYFRYLSQEQQAIANADGNVGL
jgi:integrase